MRVLGNLLKELVPYCPRPSAIHPQVETVADRGLSWALRSRLLTEDDPRAERLRAARIAWLTSLAQPTADLEALQLATDWHTWLFFHDDLCDASAVGREPRRQQVLDEMLTRALRDGDLASPHPLARSLVDVRRRLERRAGEAWSQRFAAHVESYFRGNLWEAVNRQRLRVPDLATYVAMRRVTGAVDSCFDLVFAGAGFAADSELLADPGCRRLARMANRHICWINDVFGLEKELQEGNVNNLVLVLRHHERIGARQAIHRALAMCDAEMRRFLDLESRLRQSGAFAVEDFDRYGRLLRSWMRGHVDWDAETGRYSGDLEEISLRPRTAAAAG